MRNENPTIQMPELYEGNLDDAMLDALLRDIERLPCAVEVRLKHEARRYIDDALRPSLREAAETLRAGACRAVQLRYTHDGLLWCDTVMRVEGGYRLARAPLPR